MALRRGFGQQTINTRDGLSDGPSTFWLPSNKETTLVLLDDEPTECVRHQQYLKGDKRGNGMRVTCAGMDPAASPDPVPRECKACNAQLQMDRIARKHLIYLTVIDERSFEYEGKTFKDMKRLLELGPDAADLFDRRKKSQGTLVGSRWKVYRSKNKRSARHGDDWNFLGFVFEKDRGEAPQNGLMRHFWSSPAIKAIRENAGKGDKPRTLSHQEAVLELIKPYDYEELMGKYDPKKADAFVAYHESAIGSLPPGDRKKGKGGDDDDDDDEDGPPKPPSAGAPGAPAGPDYATGGPPAAPSSMPTGHAPAAPSAPAYAPPQGQPMPPVQGVTSPQGTFTGQYAPPPMPAAPPAPMASTGAYAPPPFPGAPAAPAFGGYPTPPGAPAMPATPPGPPPPPMPTGYPGAGYNFGAPAGPAPGPFPAAPTRPSAPASQQPPAQQQAPAGYGPPPTDLPF